MSMLLRPYLCTSSRMKVLSLSSTTAGDLSILPTCTRDVSADAGKESKLSLVSGGSLRVSVSDSCLRVEAAAPAARLKNRKACRHVEYYISSTATCQSKHANRNVKQKGDERALNCVVGLVQDLLRMKQGVGTTKDWGD